jgi:uncharacterized protein with HEPN domain
MSRDHRVLLEDMLESCERILQYGEGLSFEKFSEGGMVFDAVVRRLSIVGEAAARIPRDVRDRNPEVE